MTSLFAVFVWIIVGSMLCVVMSWVLDATVPPYEPRHRDNDPHVREGAPIYDWKRDGL